MRTVTAATTATWPATGTSPVTGRRPAATTAAATQDNATEEARWGLVNDLLERLDKNKGLDEEEDKPVDPYPL